MHGLLFSQLRQQQFSIRARWDTLLRAEPVTSPLAYPDSLTHLIDTTLGEIFTLLEGLPGLAHQRAALSSETPRCGCGRNPLLTYFSAGKQAMLEGLILAQVASAPLDPVHRDASLEELTGALREIATREIEAFCGVCQFRRPALAGPEPRLALGSG